MEIEIKRCKSLFYDFGALNPGDVFEYSEGIYYIKTNGNWEDPTLSTNAVDVKDFGLYTFKDDDKVRFVDSKLIIDD